MSNSFLTKLVDQRSSKMSIIDATLAVASDEERDLSNIFHFVSRIDVLLFLELVEQMMFAS